MTRNISSRVTSLLLGISLLASAGCCAPAPAAQHPAPPPIHDDERNVAALDAQLKTAETAGWNKDEERAFSLHLATLSPKTRLEYARRLARDMTFGKIKLQPPAPPPENAPACPCGGNSCGAAVVSTAPPVTAVPGRADRQAR